MCADFIHKITVQASPGLEKRRNSPDLGSGSSPSFGPRFRAIQREYSYFPSAQIASDHVFTRIPRCNISVCEHHVLSCCLKHTSFVFPLCPCGPLPAPPVVSCPVSLSPSLLPALSLTHTLFPFLWSAPVQLLSDFLSRSALLFLFSPTVDLLLFLLSAVVTIQQEGEPSSYTSCAEKWRHTCAPFFSRIL